MIEDIRIESIDINDIVRVEEGRPAYFGTVNFEISYGSSFLNLRIPFEGGDTLDAGLKDALETLHTFGAELQDLTAQMTGE